MMAVMPSIEVKGFASLNKGFYKIEVGLFQTGGGMVCDISIEGPEMEKQIIPAGKLFHEGS